MTTNLVISYPDIPFRAVHIRPSATMSTGFEAENCITGQRGYGFKINTAATSYQLAFDLGGSVTATADHLIVARPDVSTFNTMAVQRGSNGSAWTSEYTDSAFNATTLRYGPRSQDYLATFTLSSAYRWWQLSMSHTSSTQFQLSKTYLGTFFDFGGDPDECSIQQLPARESVFYSDAGAGYFARNEWPLHRFSATWTLISDAVKQSWMSKIVRHRHRNHVYLVTRSDHTILNNYRLIYSRLVDHSATQDGKVANTWRITASFEEVLR